MFIKDDTVNPLTLRKIKKNGPVYTKLAQQCTNSPKTSKEPKSRKISKEPMETNQINPNPININPIVDIVMTKLKKSKNSVLVDDVSKIVHTMLDKHPTTSPVDYDKITDDVLDKIKIKSPVDYEKIVNLKPKSTVDYDKIVKDVIAKIPQKSPVNYDKLDQPTANVTYSHAHMPRIHTQ